VTTTDWWDRVPFDGVLCDMALMDIDDLEGALSCVSAIEAFAEAESSKVPGYLVVRCRLGG
jgi:hypothetical protein